MRVLVKRGFSLIYDKRFDKGPVNIGRRRECHISLPDRSVSRKHAMILKDPKGNWYVQDMESANQTLVNGKPVSRVPLSEGDVISIADFTIEVHMDDPIADSAKEVSHNEEQQVFDQRFNLSETVIAHELKESIYSCSCRYDRVVELAPRHLKDFYDINLALFNLNDEESFLEEFTSILKDQFQAAHVWAGLRETTAGPLTCYYGRGRGGAKLDMTGMPGKHIIRQAVDTEKYILVPDFSDSFSPEDTRLPDAGHVLSAMAAPIVAPIGIYGIIYLDNWQDCQPYDRQDLDYLSLLSIQVAAFSEKIG